MASVANRRRKPPDRAKPRSWMLSERADVTVASFQDTAGGFRSQEYCLFRHTQWLKFINIPETTLRARQEPIGTRRHEACEENILARNVPKCDSSAGISSCHGQRSTSADGR